MWIFKQLLRQWRTLGIRVWRRLLRSERRQWSVRRQRSVEEAALGSPSPRLPFQLSSQLSDAGQVTSLLSSPGPRL